MSDAAAAGSGDSPAAGPQLLLVEDEESIGALVRVPRAERLPRSLGTLGGEDALASLVRVRPRLVVLDIGLPGKDGFDVCRGIRARSAVPIVMLTARDEEADRVAGLWAPTTTSRSRSRPASSPPA